MKIRTNLTSQELDRVAKGISEAAHQHGDKFTTQNAAEDKLDSKITEAYDVMTSSLIKTINRIIKE